MTEQELRAFLAAETTTSPSGLRNKALLTLMATSGLRVGEALALRPRDLVRDGEGYSVRLANTKAGVPDVVPVNAEAAALLGHWLERRQALGLNGGAPIFCTVSTGTLVHGVPERSMTDGRFTKTKGRSTQERDLTVGRPLTRQYVHTLVKRLAEQAGIDPARVSAHSLRHTCGTLVYKHTSDRLTTQKLLRHGAASVTEGYIAAAQLDTRAAVDALPSVLSEPEPAPSPDPMAAFVATLNEQQREALAAALQGTQSEARA